MKQHFSDEQFLYSPVVKANLLHLLRKESGSDSRLWIHECWKTPHTWLVYETKRYYPGLAITPTSGWQIYKYYTKSLRSRKMKQNLSTSSLTGPVPLKPRKPHLSDEGGKTSEKMKKNIWKNTRMYRLHSCFRSMITASALLLLSFEKTIPWKVSFCSR